MPTIASCGPLNQMKIDRILHAAVMSPPVSNVPQNALCVVGTEKSGIVKSRMDDNLIMRFFCTEVTPTTLSMAVLLFGR